MPSPRPGESRKNYLRRCIPIVMRDGTAESKEQAAAICYSMFKKKRSKTVNNEGGLQTFSVNVNGAEVREEVLDGELYWVAPMVLMTECVASGSSGPLYYPKKELKKWSPAWNHKPIVVNHPKNGSACTKKFLDKARVGMVMNTVWDGKQRSEGWFHQKHTREKEPRIAAALEDKRMMELSTGLHVDVVNRRGIFKGKRYKGIAVDHCPDHVAILPDKVGACSIKDGAGLLQLNEISHDEIRMELEGLLLKLYADEIENRPSLGSPWVRTVFDESCIFHFGGKMFEIDYQKADDEVSLVGDPVEVKPKVEYVPVDNADLESEEDDMAKVKSKLSKKELIDKIINNKQTKWVEKDRKSLERLDDDTLWKLEPIAVENEEEGVHFDSEDDFEAAVTERLDKEIKKDPKMILERAGKALSKNKESDSEEEEEDTEKTKVKNQKEKKMTPEEFMAMMPPQFRNVHNQAMKALQAEQNRLVSTIVANKNNVIKEDDLKKMDIDMLRNMAALCKPVKNEEEDSDFSNYFLGGAPVKNKSQEEDEDEDEETLELPVYNHELFNSRGKGIPRGKKKVAVEDDDE